MGTDSMLISACQLPDWSAGGSREQEGNGGAQAPPPLMMMTDGRMRRKKKGLSCSAMQHSGITADNNT